MLPKKFPHINRLRCESPLITHSHIKPFSVLYYATSNFECGENFNIVIRFCVHSSVQPPLKMKNATIERDYRKVL
jgi:hypothetical protein